jgi:transposase InsO family protein
VTTDNGAAFESVRYAKVLRWLGIAHKRTRAGDTSGQRREELPAFRFRYN